MTTRAQKVRLAIFALIASGLLVAGIVVLVGLKLWNPKDRYFVRYSESVSGLEVGSAVKMKGVRVGQVDKVLVEDVEAVKIVLALDPKTPVKRDTVAVLSSIGITGLKFIELTGSSKRSERLKPNRKNSEIQAGESVIGSLTGKAEAISTKMERLLNNLLALTNESNITRVRTLIDNLDRLAAALAAIAVDNRRHVHRILGSADKAASTIASSVEDVATVVSRAAPAVTETLQSATEAARSFEKMATTMRPQKALVEIEQTARAIRRRVDGADLENSLNALRKSAETLQALAENMKTILRRRDGQLATILAQVNDAARNFKIFTQSIKERPSLILRGETIRERKVR